MKFAKARKPAHHFEDSHQHAAEELWIFSYADMITILMTFFIVIISISNVSSEKYQKLKEAIAKSELTENKPSQVQNAGDKKALENKDVPSIGGVPLDKISKAAAETGGDRLAQLTEGVRLLMTEIDMQLVKQETLESSEFVRLKKDLSALLEIEKSRTDLQDSQSVALFRFSLSDLATPDFRINSEGEVFLKKIANSASNLRTKPLVRIEFEQSEQNTNPQFEIQLIKLNQALAAKLVSYGIDRGLVKIGMRPSFQVDSLKKSGQGNSSNNLPAVSITFTIERRQTAAKIENSQPSKGESL